MGLGGVMGGFMVGGSVFLSLQGRQIFKNAPYEQGYLLRGRSARSANYSRSYRVKNDNFGAPQAKIFEFFIGWSENQVNLYLILKRI